MSTRQLIEITCDCDGGCLDPSHVKGAVCGSRKAVRTQSNLTARWTALVSHAWSVITEPRAGYGGRPAGRKPIGDRCPTCTNWEDPGAVVLDTLESLGLVNARNLENALAGVRETLRIPSTP